MWNNADVTLAHLGLLLTLQWTASMLRRFSCR